jgi:hypothetical protein
MPAFPQSKKPEEPLPEDPLDDSVMVRAWRLTQAHDLGYRLAECEIISQASFDLHDLRGLIGKGADPSVALRILL